jgi:polar amino acid transport system permease protein
MPKKYLRLAAIFLLAMVALPVITAGVTADETRPGVQGPAGDLTQGLVTIVALEDTEARSKIANAQIYIDGAYAGETDTAEGKLRTTVGPGEHLMTASKKGLNNASALVMPGGNYTLLLSGAGKKYSIFDVDVFFYALSKELEYGAVNTILLSVVSTLIGLVIGLIMGIGRVSSNRVVRGMASVYVEAIRGVPMLLLLLFIKYGLPFFILETFQVQLVLDAFSACVIAISMNCGAYMGEIFKAGINAIGKGQMEAARSLGMSYGQSLRFIILPQAIRVVLPALGNEFISIIKGSSISLVIAYPEIVWWSNNIGAETYNTFMPLVAAGIIYLCMTVPLSKFIQYIEARLSTGEAREQKTGLLPKKREAGDVLEGTV